MGQRSVTEQFEAAAVMDGLAGHYAVGDVLWFEENRPTEYASGLVTVVHIVYQPMAYVVTYVDKKLADQLMATRDDPPWDHAHLRGEFIVDADELSRR